MGKTQPGAAGEFSIAASVAAAEARLADLRIEQSRIGDEITALEAFVQAGHGVLNGSKGRRAAVSPKPASKAPAALGGGVGGRKRLRGSTLGVLAWMAAEPKRLFTTGDIRGAWPVSPAMVQKFMPRLREYGYVDEVSPRQFRVNATGIAAVAERRADGEEIPQPMS